jgi:hypothetical protein
LKSRGARGTCGSSSCSVLHGRGLGLGQHADEAFLVDAVAAGAAGDLVHFAFGQLAVALAVELGHRAEQHTLDGQVQAHADGVGGDQDVAGAGGKPFGLAAAHLRRQRAVDDRHRVALGGDLVAQHQHVAAAEGHHGVPQLQVGQRHGALQRLHVLLAFEVAHGAAFATQAQQVFDGSHRVGAADDDHLLRRHGHDGLRPGPAARAVEDHLRFVDHRHVDHGVGGHHLDGAADYARALCRHVLLAGQKAAGHPTRHQAVATFQRQQPQRRQISAIQRLRQALEGGVGLATVGRADVQHHLALQPARLLEGVGVALECQFAVQALQLVGFGGIVFPAVLCTLAGGQQLGQRLGRGAFGLQSRQQGFQVVGFEGPAARDQRFQARQDLTGLRVAGRCAQGLAQGGFIAVAVVGPDGGLRGRIQHGVEEHRHAPVRRGKGQRVPHQAGPDAGAARHAQRFQRAGARLHQRAHLRPGRHGLQVGQRTVDQRGFDPAAGPCAGHGLLQQDQTQLVQMHLEAGAAFGHVVGRLDHLRQHVGRLADAVQVFGGDVCRDAARVAGVGQAGSEGLVVVGHGSGMKARQNGHRWRQARIIAHEQHKTVGTGQRSRCRAPLSTACPCPRTCGRTCSAWATPR